MAAHLELIEALGISQRLGAFGPGAPERLVRHAMGFVDALAETRGRVVDIGSGGGVPGLVIACERPDLSLILVDRSRARIDALIRIIHRLGYADRVEARHADAAQLADEEWVPADAVVARSFGPPSAALSVARSLVHDRGRIVISEPPAGERWPASLLDRLGVMLLPAGPPSAGGRVAVFRCST